MILGNAGVKLFFRTSFADAEVLNRDITGVRGTFDIPSLKVGEAVLWRSGMRPRLIEVNAPIVPDVGSLSSLAHRFLERVRATEKGTGVGVVAPSASEIVKLDVQGVATDRDRARPKVHRAGLEDWLK